MSYQTKVDRVWCQECNKLIDHQDVAYTLQTVYKLHKDGIYAWGSCHNHSNGHIDHGRVTPARGYTRIER